MSDQKVQETQTWLNTTYGSHPQWNHLAEDGEIGWKTIYGMIRGLQIELGITTLVDNFGEGTLAQLTAQYPVISALTPKVNIRRLAQCALWCHGYQGGFQWGTFDTVTNNGIKSFLYNCGLATLSQAVPTEITPKMLKALMTLEAYTLLDGGTAAIREAQQWINSTYRNRRQSILPCDGLFTRSTQQGLMTVIQYELGETDDDADGFYGPSTKAGLAAQANLSSGATDGSKHWVRLFQCALRMNGYNAPLNGSFDAATVTATKAFQSYAELSGNGNANIGAWASLLISTGDSDRPAIASDMASQLTPSWCASLYANGYRTVGRYLSVLGKRYQPYELDWIFNAGLKTFPIMQESNTSEDDFSYEKGLDHGFQALRRLRQLGFKPGNTVFFAVDFDPTDDTITSSVIPYFQGIASRMTFSFQRFKIGVYGTRNVCARIINAGLADEAFIASMSWGWGGNLGYPLPPKWSYDQIRNQTLAGTTLEIDSNVQSARAHPAGRADVLSTPVVKAQVMPGSPATVDVFDEDYYWYLAELMTWADLSSTSTAQASKVALYWLAWLEYNNTLWQAYAPRNMDTNDVDALNLLAQRASTPEAGYGRLTHWAATTRGYLNWWESIPPTGSTVTAGDLGGFGLDLAQGWADYKGSGTSLSIRSWLGTYLGTSGSPQFDLEDMVADVDGYLVARMLRANPSRDLDDCVRSIEVSCQSDPTWRYREFVNLRFDGNWSWVANAGEHLFDPGAWSQLPAEHFGGTPPTAAQSVQLGLGFMDALKRLAGA